MSIKYFAITICIVFGSCNTQKPVLMNTTGHNTVDGADKAMGWASLFDGSSMDQWRLYKGPDSKEGVDGWQVRDEEMVALGMEGKSADIISVDTFSNFELSLEWKISKNGNSGIFFNVREGDTYDAVYHTGPEYQLLDDERYLPEIEDWQRTGANYAMHPPKINNANPQGTYNHSKVIVDDGYVQHWLNDRLVVKYHLWTPEWDALKAQGKWKDFPSYGKYKSGHIALQDHGNEVSFRNIKIRKL